MFRCLKSVQGAKKSLTMLLLVFIARTSLTERQSKKWRNHIKSDVNLIVVGYKRMIPCVCVCKERTSICTVSALDIHSCWMLPLKHLTQDHLLWSVFFFPWTQTVAAKILLVSHQLLSPWQNYNPMWRVFWQYKVFTVDIFVKCPLRTELLNVQMLAQMIL